MQQGARNVKLAYNKFDAELNEAEQRWFNRVRFVLSEARQGVDEKLLLLWMLQVGELDATASEDQINSILGGIAPLLKENLTQAETFTNGLIQDARLEAAELGYDQALRTLPTGTNTDRFSTNPTIIAISEKADTKFSSDVSNAVVGAAVGAVTLFALRRALDTITTFGGSRAEGAMSFNFNGAANEVKGSIAKEAGAQKMWVAERDACLTCLALSGKLTSGSFPADATYDDKPMNVLGDLSAPPRHPHCRCQIVPHKTTWGDAHIALEREAQRSVVKGWGDSTDAAGRRAAERLLANDPNLAKSVKEESRRRLASDRKFTREVPTYEQRS